MLLHVTFGNTRQLRWSTGVEPGYLEAWAADSASFVEICECTIAAYLFVVATALVS